MFRNNDDKEAEVERDDQVEALRVGAAGLRGPVHMRDRAFAALALLVPRRNMRYDLHIDGRHCPGTQDIELAQATAARYLRIWMGPLPRPIWRTLGSSSPIEPWFCGARMCFVQMYGGPLPANADQHFSIPASWAEE
jgi:hypothetical protein